MSDDILQLQQDVANGEQAVALIQNPLLQSIIYSQKNAACEAFMNTNRTDDNSRRDAWQNVQGFIAIEQNLQALIEQGKIAKTLLDEYSQSKETISNNPLEGK